MIRDNGDNFGGDFDRVAQATGIKVLRTPQLFVSSTRTFRDGYYCASSSQLPDELACHGPASLKSSAAQR